ncbi:peptidoglycan editing factor PgeF [Spongiibacter pelagi]|uniref:peptidoglycan editing factor PgeF n=1 Tax=Spongiibacter pelagi TaxID=2760804 RepID=UPI00295BFDA4|nr:peptidoglycan editing factor PgeF [Spongiibacter pelagi]
MIKPDWPAPANVVAMSTTRLGLPEFEGASQAPYAYFNLGDHVGDSPVAVAENRQALLQHCDNLQSLGWLNQVHGTVVHPLNEAISLPLDADASISSTPGMASVVMTADCLPVLFCDQAGRQVAAAHAGWRGLCDGVLLETVKAFAASPDHIMAWMGPAISSAHFEVGPDVLAQFLDHFEGVSKAQIQAAFSPSPSREAHYYADLYALARAQLSTLGLAWIGGGEYCTFADSGQFYSYRRDGVCGRQASLIYLRA